jgi:hypothetical protein
VWDPVAAGQSDGQAAHADLTRDVSQLITIDKAFLTERVGRLDPRLLSTVDGA